MPAQRSPASATVPNQRAIATTSAAPTGCATTIAWCPSFPSCNGDCPPGSTCANNANPPECLCFGTVTTTPTTCTTTTAPLCGTSCSPPSCCSSTPGLG